jgi:hypothetical protein
MAEMLFADFLKSSLDVPSINQYFVQHRDKTLAVLQKLRPEGRVDGGRFKLASVEGGAGSSFDYNLQNGHWGDWAANDSHHGLIGFVSATMKCSAAQAVQFLLDEKFLDKKEAKKALSDAEGDPLVFPIPEDMQSWNKVLECDALRKDRGILRDHWTFQDVDGSILGYKYRVDSRNTTKEVYTVTFRAHSGWVKKDWAKKLVPPYGLEQLGDGTPTVRVLFVEGEKAKDRAQELLGDRWKILSYSGVKGSHDLWLPDEAFWQDAEVILWPDNDTPGREAARRVQILLQSQKYKPREIRIVRTENIPGIPPGWDIGDHTEGCPVDAEVELERAEAVDSFEHICRQWVYVAKEDKFYNLEDREIILSPAAFDRYLTRYGDKTGSPSKKFLSDLDTHRCEDLDFLPGCGTFILTPAGKKLLNEWYPSGVYVRATEIAGDSNISDDEVAEKAKYFIAHLQRISGNEIVEPEKNTDGIPIGGTEKRLLSDALAFYFHGVVTRPMDKQGWFPVLVSEHNGTGKSYFRRVMAALLGGKRVQELTVQRYVSDYEDWMDGTLFYELGEVKSHDSAEVYELLKKNHSYLPFNEADLRDRSQGTRHINIKGTKQKLQRNFLNGYMTSNDLFPLALANSSGLEGSDRRLLAVNCEQILTELEADQLFDELSSNAAYIGAWLMRYKSEAPWNPGWAPITKHKRRMLEKDRERSENKADKYELGKFDEFYHLVRWAMEEKIGLFARPVQTAEGIRGLSEARRVKFPWDIGRFERILEKAGLMKGPVILLDGQPKKTYTSDDKMIGKSVSEWTKAAKESINPPSTRPKKDREEDAGGGHF